MGGSRTGLLVTIATALAGIALVVVALEGIVCILLASPLGLGAALIGGIFGRSIALYTKHTPRQTLGGLALLPLVFAVGKPPASDNKLRYLPNHQGQCAARGGLEVYRAHGTDRRSRCPAVSRGDGLPAARRDHRRRDRRSTPRRIFDRNRNRAGDRVGTGPKARIRHRERCACDARAEPVRACPCAARRRLFPYDIHELRACCSILMVLPKSSSAHRTSSSSSRFSTGCRWRAGWCTRTTLACWLIFGVTPRQAGLGEAVIRRTHLRSRRAAVTYA